MPKQFHMIKQTEWEWCWAAVAATIKDYFSPLFPLKQCEVANQVFGTNQCCHLPVPPQFDIPQALDDVLTDLNNLQQKLNTVLSFDQIKAQIALSFPVCARITWFGGGGHFVVIYGWGVSASGDQWVDVGDPFFYNSTILYEQLVNSYQDAGDWTDTFLVRP